MTLPPHVNPRTRLFPLVFILGAILVFISCAKAVALGDCRTRPDTALVASSVTQQSCHDQCATCTWTQGPPQ